jgi:plastocyanin
MKIIFNFILIFALLITFSSLPQDAFASTVKPVSGSGAPGCEESGGCYSPMVQFVELGDKVLFINTDSSAHTFTSGSGSPDGEFDSGLVMANGDFSHKFSNPGAYNYFCMVHPWMTGVIQVTETYTPPTPTPSYTPPTPTPSYTPPTTSSIDWQQRYLDVLSDFNDVSAKVGQLERTNQQLVVDGAGYRIESEGLREEISDMQNTISVLNTQNTDLKKSVENLNAVIMEQVKVIYEWVLGK